MNSDSLLPVLLADTWKRLEEGVDDTASPFHAPTVASLRDDLTPDVRTVILRGMDAANGTLRFHTDARSGKVAQLAARADCAIHIYAPPKLQIRLDGRATLHAGDDAVANEAWASARPSSLVPYAQTDAPGTRLRKLAEPTLRAKALAPEQVALARANFCAVMVKVERIDRLMLESIGNTRAAWVRNDAGWDGCWLAP